MRKALKIAGWTALAGLLLLLAAAAAAKLYFTPARLKALTLDYARRNLGREVAFDEIKLGLSGLALSGLRVSEYPDFKKGEFLNAGSFSLRPALRQLLRGELRINSVSASGLKLRVREVKKDTYNFSDLIAQEPPRPPRPQQDRQPQPPPRLEIASLKVKDSAFSYANAAGDLKVELSGIALSASGISPDGLFPVEGDFTLALETPYFKGSLPARVKGRLALGNFDAKKGRAEIEKASISYGGLKAELKGAFTNLLEPDGGFSLSLAPFSTGDLRPIFSSLPHKVLLPEIDADADLKLTASGVTLRTVAFRAGAASGNLRGRAAWDPAVTYDLSAEVKAQLPELDTTQLARRAKNFPVPRGYKLPMTTVQATLRLRPGLADVQSFSADSDAYALTGRAAVNYAGASPKASGSLKADVKNLAKLAAAAPELAKGYALSGKASARVDFAYDKAPSAKGSAELAGAGGAFGGHDLSGLNGRLDFTMNAASGALDGRLDGEKLKFSFKARDFARHPKAEFDLDLAKLTLKDQPAAAPAPAAKAAGGGKAPASRLLDLTGRVEIGAVDHPNFKCGPVKARMELRNISEDMKALDGSAAFNAGPGRLSELYKLAARYKAAKVALYPLLALQKASKLVKGLNLPDFNNIDFEIIEGDYSFSKGLMRLNRSAMTAEVADVSSTGSIDLPAERMDLRVATTLKKGSGVTLGAPLAMTVKGPLSDPSVKPDIKSIAEQPAVKKALDRLAPEGSKLLKNLFKK